MNLAFLLLALIALASSSRLDDLVDFFKTSPTYNQTVDAIIHRTGLLGFALSLFLLYIIGSEILLALRDYILRITFVQAALSTIEETLTAMTLLSILNLISAVFTSFVLSAMVAFHQWVKAMVATVIIKIKQLVLFSLGLATQLWPIVDTSILLFGTMYELFYLPEEILSLLALSLLVGIFSISGCALVIAVTTFVLELGYCLASELERLLTSFAKSTLVLSTMSALSVLLHDFYLFVYLSDGTVYVNISDIPMPSRSPIVTTADFVLGHVRSISSGSTISKATQGSVISSKISGQQTAAFKVSHNSTSSFDFSGQSTSPLRPGSRSSDPTTASDLDQCIEIVDSCMERIQELESENQTLREKDEKFRELEVELQILRQSNEQFRHGIFQAGENFLEHLCAYKSLQAANTELVKQSEYYRHKLIETEDDFEARINEFILAEYPQKSDIVSDSASSSANPTLPFSHEAPSTTPTSGHPSLRSPVKLSSYLPETPSTDSTLPFSPRTPDDHNLGHLSPNSLIKPINPRTPTGPGLPTPQPMKRSFDPNVKILELRTPTTVSSGRSLPAPSTASTDSSYPSSFDESPMRPPISALPFSTKRYRNGIPLFPAGPGLLSPMGLVFGNRIPQQSTPTSPSEGSPLPYPTPVPAPSTFGRVSINSLTKPYFGRHVEVSPLANRRKKFDPESPIDRPCFKTPYARARAQRFLDSLEFEASPSSASSCSTLPVPSPSTTSSNYDPFI